MTMTAPSPSSAAVLDVRADAATALRIATLLSAIAGVTAAGVGLFAADPVRRLLGFTFSGVPAGLGSTLSILANNLRMLGAVVLACAIAQLAGANDRLSNGLVRACDGVIVGVATAHAVAVGAGVGAYGGRMLVALLPHGPVELWAFSLALALYVAARRDRITWEHCLAIFMVCALQLSVAAALEVFVAP
jgi:hypothetical protein